ncbi:LOW QUALITY PROTEIN: zinc-binding protein A33-like [Puntigrus tetrazona]|uniref:LOW QUALITY PROTEIN: zinc-binding protein A33-like n=1 Tax=Puntigrus tetrazona TaxID=1606681 RepID=UPI001C8981DE|nr:LOW QUALITY PROTEIN: zinc-binding protein A33-like [Puntigrus tetrazona]
MAFVKRVSLEDLSCPVCTEIFKAPVMLSCSHSVCKECLQKFWQTRNTQDCPVCRRRSSKLGPPCNLVLKNLCESLTVESASGSEEVCSLHNEQLKLLCLDDDQLVCVVCRDSEKHGNHRFRPVNEVVPSYKEQLKTALTSLQEKLKHTEKMKKEYNTTVLQTKTQAEHTEQQIKEEFKKLHQFLRDEEKTTIAALRKEEEQKSQKMKEKLEEINRQISALSETIEDIEEKMNASDVSILQEFNVTMERAQSSQLDPEMLSGALIDVADHLRNLTFRVWKKMQELVQNTPVTLDPNTAHPRLILSDDLTCVKYSKTQQLVPDNPERFEIYSCVPGSHGFNSGKHFWDVEVGDNSWWIIGVTTESNQRKGADFFNTNVWCVWYNDDKYFSQSQEIPNNPFSVEEKLQKLRLELDWDRGKLSFCDAVTNKHLCTLTTIFTEKVFPFFYSCDERPLRILPAKVVVGVQSVGEPPESNLYQGVESI